MPNTKNDLAVATREKINALLNAQLVDALDLRMQAKQAHWNVKGPSFAGLHELFDEVASKAAEISDEIAERITALGGVAAGTVTIVAERTRLPNYPLDIFSGQQHVEALSTSLASFGETLRAAIDEAESQGDAGTADLLTGASREFDKLLWMVEAHQQADH